MGLTGLASGGYEMYADQPTEEMTRMGAMSTMGSTDSLLTSHNEHPTQNKELNSLNMTSSSADYTSKPPSHAAAANKSKDAPFPTSVPSGKFWKVVKQNGHTLYQCPFDDCG